MQARTKLRQALLEVEQSVSPSKYTLFETRCSLNFATACEEEMINFAGGNRERRRRSCPPSGRRR